MQDWRFDDLTRTLAKATSRRQVLKGLVGGLAASLMVRSAGSKNADAMTLCDWKAIQDCKANAQSIYTEQMKVCRGFAQDGYQDGGWGAFIGCAIQATRSWRDDVAQCRTQGGCSTGTCCAGNCVDTQNDHDNCGGCGASCTPCQICQDGQCVDFCGDNATCCNDQCVGTQCTAPKIFDPSQCSCVCPFGGDCGDTCCQNGQICCNGQCVNQCPPGQQLDPNSCECVCSTGETCGPFCCSSNKVCCPDVLTGMACKDKDANCPGCQETCGDICCNQGQYCCRAADYSFHCLDNSGDTC